MCHLINVRYCESIVPVYVAMEIRLCHNKIVSRDLRVKLSKYYTTCADRSNIQNGIALSAEVTTHVHHQWNDKLLTFFNCSRATGRS